MIVFEHVRRLLVFHDLSKKKLYICLSFFRYFIKLKLFFLCGRRELHTHARATHKEKPCIIICETRPVFITVLISKDTNGFPTFFSIVGNNMQKSTSDRKGNGSGELLQMWYPKGPHHTAFCRDCRLTCRPSLYCSLRHAYIRLAETMYSHR